MRKSTLFIAFVIVVCRASTAFASDDTMSFFVTSAGLADGGNLGGLNGADAHCQNLATQVGSSGKSWRAYLSIFESNGQSAVNARDRIGKGPWHNANGILIAKDIDDLHSDNNTLSKANSLNEQGQEVNGRGDDPNRHDILTGSLKDGTASKATCNNWQSNSQGKAMVGHHDKQGPPDRLSWNSAHESFGCSLKDLTATGGDGLFYCFAEN